MDQSNPEHCKTGRYHDGNCKGPSQIKCCIIHANDNDGEKDKQCCKSRGIKIPKLHTKCPPRTISVPLSDCEPNKNIVKPDPKPNQPDCTADTKHVYPRCKAHKGSVWAFCGKIEVKKWGIGKEGKRQAIINCNYASHHCKGGHKMGKCADISKKANIKPFINKLCSAKTAKNLVGKCMDESNPEHCKTCRYHDGNCKGPSHVRCCITHASDTRFRRLK